MLTAHNPDTISPPVAFYSHGIEVPAGARTLHIAGVVGVTPEGTMPIGFEAQHRRIWLNVIEVLKSADMGVEDLVRLNVFSLDPADVFMVSEGRQEFLNGHKPVSTYLAVKGLARPEFLVEMDAVACKVD
ncbi:MAG: RidA family protein [Alphaproteobacteria bacterium]|nr:RidA family protein [Alphaproteobacteria bacterium]